MPRTFLARIVVTLVIGLVVGVLVGKSVQHDYEVGKNLTMKQYIADFDKYKHDLMKNDVPVVYDVVGGIVLVLLVIGLYELLVLGVDKLFGVFGRHRDVTVHPGPPAPW
ncbi:MAG TPA: hypothetical protein VGU74_10550 [Gemmatimonadales bacterium]|nr:hypothetical protein [Gemmatimonadales bacterium]